MDLWPDDIKLIMAPGCTPVPVLPAYSPDALVTTLHGWGWWKSFVHCGPAASLPARELVKLEKA